MAGSNGFKSALGKVGLGKALFDAAQPVLQQIAGRVAPDAIVWWYGSNANSW